ncbi:MAG: zinc-ribbon and DUF3426 domain-containing protein [Gallionella sp.]
MDGTTRCPHCETRFKIGVTQLEAHQGMVRCGKCMQIFDARPDFIPDLPSPQLELVIADLIEAPTETIIPEEVELSTPEVFAESEPGAATEEVVTEVFPEHVSHQEDALDFVTPRPPVHQTKQDNGSIFLDNDDTIDESIHHGNSDEDEVQPEVATRRWLWAVPAAALTLLLIAQAAYIFRAEIAARQPELKPVLLQYCEFLDCKVGLPQSNELMSIESSTLEANPNYSRHITLKALLRNRASYPLAYPNLELTLNDRQDSPVARRIFKPSDYLPSKDKVDLGLQANNEISVELYLDTTDLNPNGYRLVLFYPSK